MDDGVEVSVWVDDGVLNTQASGNPRRRATPASETQFFYKRNNNDVEFVVESGRVTGMVIHLNGGEETMRAERVGDLPARKQAISVDAETLDRYVGVYAIGSQFDLTIRRDGTDLTAQASGQGSFPLQAMSATGFFNDNVGIEVEFIVEEDEVVAAVIRQGAREIRAERKP